MATASLPTVFRQICQISTMDTEFLKMDVFTCTLMYKYMCVYKGAVQQQVPTN